jgi:hypothetical protein
MGSTPDSGVNMGVTAGRDFERCSAENGFITQYADRVGRKKGSGFPKPLF